MESNVEARHHLRQQGRFGRKIPDQLEDRPLNLRLGQLEPAVVVHADVVIVRLRAALAVGVASLHAGAAAAAVQEPTVEQIEMLRGDRAVPLVFEVDLHELLGGEELLRRHDGWPHGVHQVVAELLR